MKYQQLENLESGWKWKYLVKKHREGELITCYIEASAAQEAVDMLLTLENEPVQVNGWIEKHINPGSVWPGLRNGAGKPCRKRWCS